jgi:hypothetical protein
LRPARFQPINFQQAVRLLLILEVWLALAVTVCVLGVAVERFLTRGIGADGEALDGGIVALLGLAALTTVAGLLSLVLPMNGVGVAAVAAFVAGVGWRCRADLRRRFASMLAALASRSRLDLLVGLLVIAAALVWACAPTPLYDHGAYHGQAVRWAEEFAAVPGLANLQFRLALVPTWFVVQAASSGSFLGERIVALNSFAFLCVALYLWNGLPLLRRSSERPSAWFRVLGLPGGLLIANELLSHATPDLPVAMLWLALLGLALEEIEEPSRPAAPRTALALVALTLFSVSLRLSALPALSLVVWIVARRPEARRFAARVLAVAVCLAAPCILRNVVQSGYPFFPLAWPSSSQLDWTVPREVLDSLQQAIRSSARGSVTPNSSWLAAWVRGLLWPDRVALALVPLAAALSWGSLSTRLGALLSPLRGLLACGLLSLAFWVATAPDPRFARGLYLPLALIVAIRLGGALEFRGRALHHPRAPRVALAAVCLLCLLDLSRAVRLLPPATWLRVERPSFPSVAQKVGPLTIHRTTREAGCWYEPFPCIADTPAIEARGKSLQRGFRPASAPP